jgi:hypothetical protein
VKIHNIYADENGESHFRDIDVELDKVDEVSAMSKTMPASGVIFRHTQGAYELDWHPAPRRQYIVNLDGPMKITASDGEARTVGPGEIILVEDTTGKGHRTEAVDGKPRHSIQIPID